MEKSHNNKNAGRRGLKGSSKVKPEVATVATAISLLMADKATSERLLLAAQTSKNYLAQLFVAMLLPHIRGHNEETNTQPLPNDEKQENAELSTSEVIALINPKLDAAALLVHLVQVIYPFMENASAEDAIYYYYAVFRVLHVQLREPTKAEAAMIWKMTLDDCKNVPMVVKHLKMLEAESELAAKDWIEQTKENARRKFLTFVRQIKRTQANAERTVNNIIQIIFNDSSDDTEDTH